MTTKEELVQEEVAIGKVFGIEDPNQCVEVAGLVDGILSAAFEAAFLLYEPLDGVHPDAGVYASPSAAAESVLRDVAEAAPNFPDWASFENPLGLDEYDLYDLTDMTRDIVTGVMKVCDALGSASIGGDTDQLVEAGRAALHIIASMRGTNGEVAAVPC